MFDNVSGIVLVFEFKNQKIMNIQSLIMDLRCVDDTLNTAGFLQDSPSRATIAETIEVMQQKLEQCNVLSLRELIEKELRGDQLFVDACTEEGTNMYYTGKTIAYKTVMELMEDI